MILVVMAAAVLLTTLAILGRCFRASGATRTALILTLCIAGAWGATHGAAMSLPLADATNVLTHSVAAWALAVFIVASTSMLVLDVRHNMGPRVDEDGSRPFAVSGGRSGTETRDGDTRGWLRRDPTA